MNSKLVYSTDDSVNFNDEITESIKIKPSDQYIRIHLDRKGGGKIVSVIKGMKLSNTELNSLAKEFKKQCGVGGSVKHENILIQGNFREKLRDLLTQQGYNVKLSGG
jgi:translation initiation factor 1